MTINVRLKQRVLSEDHTVVMIRPGKGYRLIGDFWKAGAVAPDVPLLEVPPGTEIKNSRI